MNSAYNKTTGVLHVETSGDGVKTAEGSFNTTRLAFTYALDMIAQLEGSISLGLRLAKPIGTVFSGRST